MWILKAAQTTVGTECPHAKNLALRLSLSFRIVNSRIVLENVSTRAANWSCLAGIKWLTRQGSHS